MNYDKKRKRQSGRQARMVQDCYSCYIDDEGKIHAKLYRARPPEFSHGFASMKLVTREELANDYPDNFQL